ncbi:MAG TPA: penicillin-binding transpeptidase domain-containing protein [Anaeromyxobacteraceae bacterium]|nr:penicillin-binding transpeptidase domain-containing protein [Anaeromyxobacteraceae bacterium]
MDRSRLAPILLLGSAAFFGGLAIPWHGTASELAPGATAEEPAEPAAAPLGARLSMGDFELDEDSGRYVAPLGGGRASLTLDPALQSRLTRLLADYRVPWGATVLIEPRSGRVLALAEHSQKDPEARGLSLQAMAPAASIFKIVTTAALLERGVGPDAEVCYHGGKHALSPRHLADDPRRDRRCLTLASALGHSANVVFAKLADRGLSAELLRSEAERFLWNAPIPFARPVEVSRADIPDDPFSLAQTAAGFGAVRLSALHGALVAAIVANGGVFVPPQIVDSVEGAPRPGGPAARRVVDERVAASLGEMMRTTVSEGTARRFFRDRQARAAFGDLPIAGKTGSLAEKDPYRDYSWFVGFAPADDPKVAVASVVVNERLWRVKAPYVAREALRAWFQASPERAHASLGSGARAAARSDPAR